MRSVKLIAVLVPLLLLVGCAKKVVKKPSADDSANAKASNPAPTPAPNDRDRKSDKKDGKGAEPNWLNDSRFKKEKEKEQPATPPPAGGATGKESWGIAPPQGGWEGANPGVGPIQPAGPGGMPPGPGPAPGGLPVAPAGPGPGPGVDPGAAGVVAPGAGAVPPPPGVPAAPGLPPTQNKRVEMADLKEVWIYIENASGAGGKMPTQKMVYDALVLARSPAAELVRTGAIYLTGSTARESVWAFEVQALTSGGLVASQNGVETLTAAELKARLGK